MTNSLFNQQEANKERHSWNDVVLDVPVKHIESTNITPRPWNTPQVMCDALELPVQRACWWLRELGVETLASTANAKNIGNYAGIAISISTLSSSNKTALQIFSRQNQSVLVKDDSITLQVHIPDGTTTARYISDQFINLIQEIGLEYQPAYWAAPMTPEDFLKTAMQKYGERQFQGQGHDPATTSIFEIVWAALSVDPDRNEIIIDSYI